MIDSSASPRRRRSIAIAVAIALAVVAGRPVVVPGGDGVAAASNSSGLLATSTTSLRTARLSAPGRSVVSDKNGWVATFTDGSRTVTLAGPQRVFAEASTPDSVVTRTWVRLLPRPFAGKVDLAWLAAARDDQSPDVLGIAFQYVAGAAPIVDGTARTIAGDASYGPLQADGTRAEGSDFSDYLGVTWTYADGTVDPPEADQRGALDCSGFVRMVLGYRTGVALSLRPATDTLPRRAFEQLAGAPGIVVIPDRGTAPADRSLLAAGDLVFFDASTNDGTQIDHVAIYLGRDTAGHDRFISSRKSADGPTMGDISGRSVLDGTGLYARSFRAVRRV